MDKSERIILRKVLNSLKHTLQPPFDKFKRRFVVLGIACPRVHAPQGAQIPPFPDLTPGEMFFILSLYPPCP
jgi:hypothetical protein